MPLRFALSEVFGDVGDFQFTEHATSRPQPKYGASEETGRDSSEDCLYLNDYLKGGTTNRDKKVVTYKLSVEEYYEFVLFFLLVPEKPRTVSPFARFRRSSPTYEFDSHLELQPVGLPLTSTTIIGIITRELSRSLTRQ